MDLKKILCVVMLLILLVLQSCSSGMNKSEEVEAIQKLICTNYVSAVNNHDVDAYTNLFTDDVIWASPNSPVARSKSEIRQIVQEKFDAVILHIEITLIEVEVMDNFSYAIGNSVGTIQPRDGSPVTPLRITGLWLLKKQADGWKISRQIYNDKG